MKKPKPFLTSRKLVAFFLAFDFAMLLLARNYFNSINEISIRTVGQFSQEETNQTLHDLEQIAALGSWENFERARNEQTGYYLHGNRRPTPESSVYFFPETLPKESFESNFAQSELKPGIEALKAAYQTGQKPQAQQAYMVLQSRVENYELGINDDPALLSDEAKSFLKVYRNFSYLQDEMLRQPSSTPDSQDSKDSKDSE